MNINNQYTNLVKVTPTYKNMSTSLPKDNTDVSNSNAFASVISQLLTEMEMESSSDSGSSIGSFLPELAMLMNPTLFSSLNGLDATSSTEDPNTLASIDVNQPNQNNSENIAQNATTSQLVPLSFQSIKPDTLNQVLGGKLSGMGDVFVRAGQQYNINPVLLTAIAQHETGNGSSPAAYQKNNIAGMMGTNGLKSYPSVEASILDMANNLSKNYLGQGLTSIAKIGAKYAPIGAGNDPTGLNNNWVKGVTGFFNTLTV